MRRLTLALKAICRDCLWTGETAPAASRCPSCGGMRLVCDAELDQQVPESDENEQPTGVMTSMRAWLEDATPGFLCGAE